MMPFEIQFEHNGAFHQHLLQPDGSPAVNQDGMFIFVNMTGNDNYNDNYNLLLYLYDD